MKDLAIKIEGLSKEYRINNYDSGNLRNALINVFKKQKKESFWALKDVNLEISKGETIGIIGKNGAGKSTLLKLLSKITAPTEGKIILNGRVASLLEVGTGFHPELTGRENIYLNGVILGMTKKEIAAVEDSIIQFSGIKNFLHTPVKNYSSGMYVRLAFAVAAHLSTEILIIDEVLSVGDYEFQKKCLGYLESSVQKQDKTVIIVSHNLNQIKNLCSRAILIEKGHIIYDGTPSETIDRYIQAQTNNPVHQKGNEIVSFEGIHEEDKHLSSSCGRRVVFHFDFSEYEKTVRAVRLWIYNERMEEIIMANSFFFITDPINDKEKKISCTIPKLPLNKGTYHIMIEAISNHGESTPILNEQLIIHQDLFYPKKNLPPSGRISFLLDYKWERKS